MKKILSLFLAALMIFSVLPAAFAADVETIANIEETSPYAEAIKFLANDSIAVYKGQADGNLAVNQGVKRWEAALFLYRAATGDVAEADIRTNTNYTPFKDIDIGDFDGSAPETLGAIAWAAQAKITNGVSATEFDPTAGILYQDAITMIVRLLGERYTASSYPYGFVTTARELGILDGITGVGLEQEITRGEFAQLLYNAMFVEIDGVSLAEKAFEVGKTTVLITASNNFVYEAGADKVLRTNKVRFAEIDAQGEPTGADFHADLEVFDLADAKAADQAVGTLYSIYYKDSMAEIISAEALWTVYENKGHDKIEISANSTNKTITIDGSTYRIVSKYTDLNRKQGVNSTAAGTNEMKVYVDTHGAYGAYNTKYIIASNGNIYEIGASITTPTWFYSDVLDVYYQAGNDGKWTIKTPEEMDYILREAEATLPGFSTVNTASVSAYTKATVSANERVTLREYQFGTITFAKSDYKKPDGTYSTASADNRLPTFVLNTNESASATGFTTYAKDSSDDTASAHEKFVKDYVWSGIQQSAIPSGSYILYYINETEGSKEIEVIEIIDATAEEDSYVFKAYVRGFDLAKNTITFSKSANSALETLAFDYGTLKGGQIKPYHKDKNPYVNNFNLFDDLYDKYVEMVVVDGKLVYIKGANATANYVIIDNFVDFTEEGVKVQGWSTVADGYTTFTIKSFNGWTVGGDFNYYAYFLSNLFGGLTQDSFLSTIPFSTKTLYKVVSVDGDNYDLTDKGSKKSLASGATKALKVNEYGIIEGVNSSGTLGNLNYTNTTDKDYWMILDNTTKEVYSINGKVNPVVTFTTGAEIYTAKQDFVIIVDGIGANGEMQASDTFMGKDVAFVMYDKEVNMYNNMNYPGWSTYEYTLYMTNVLNNEIKTVQISNTLLKDAGYQANQMWANANLVEGNIYKVIDGKLMDLTAYDYEDVANYYVSNTKAYEDSAAAPGVAASKQIAGGSTWAQILDLITVEMEKQLQPGMMTGTDFFDAKVTIFHKNGHVQAKSTKSSNSIAKYTVGAGKEYTMYYIIDEVNGTATAWVDAGEYVPAKAKNVPVTASWGTLSNGTYTATGEWTGNICDRMSYNPPEDPAGEYFYSTITFPENNKLSFANEADYLAADDKIKVDVTFADGYTTTYTRENQGAVDPTEGICLDYLETDKTVAFVLINFAFDLDAHGFVKSYTVTIDKGANAAVQLTVVNPNF